MNVDYILARRKHFNVLLTLPRESVHLPYMSVHLERVMTPTVVYALLWRYENADLTSVQMSILDEFMREWFPFKNEPTPLAKKWIG